MKNKSLKYRFYPTKQQEELLTKTFGSCRFVWNYILDWRNKEYTLHGKKINYVQSAKKLTEIKQEFEWLYDVSNVALQQCLRNQDKAFSNFFAKRAKYPNFKKKTNEQSFRIVGTSLRIKDGKVYMPKSEQPLKIKWSRPLVGEVSSMTISKDCAGRYFVSFCTTQEIEHLPTTDKKVGTDVGLTDFLVTSDGVHIKPLKSFVKNQNRLAILQKRLSKKKKGSKNREKARLKVAKLHAKIADSRKDFLHKTSTRLIQESQLIACEDLNVKGLMKNRKLSKAIADASWSDFINMLEYKADWYGRVISKCSPFYPSSQICSSCGHRGGKKPLHIRKWTCESCGTHHQRDVNAAKNILTAGLAEFACGASTIGELSHA